MSTSLTIKYSYLLKFHMRHTLLQYMSGKNDKKTLDNICDINVTCIMNVVSFLFDRRRMETKYFRQC